MKTKIDIECLKESSSTVPVFTSKGMAFGVSTQCVRAECIRRLTRIGHRAWDDELVSKEIVDMRLCLK